MQNTPGYDSSYHIPEQPDFGLLFEQAIFLVAFWKDCLPLESYLQTKSSIHQ